MQNQHIISASKLSVFFILLLCMTVGLSKNPPAQAKSSPPSKSANETPEQKQAKPINDEAAQLCQTSMYPEAIDKYRKALAIDPGNSTAILGLGVCFYDLKRYYSALEQLDQAVVLLPNLPEPWLTRARTFENMGKLDQAIPDYKKYVSLIKDSDEKSKYGTLIDVLQSQANSKTTTPATPNAGHNYLADATASGASRWPGKKCSLVYYVEPPDSVPGYKPEFDEFLRQSFGEWADASAGKIEFTRVYTPTEPGITVTWTDDLHAPALVAEAGFTRCEWDGKGIKSAHIQLLTVSPFKDEPLTNYLLHNICLHEIGHALGISGHSPEKDDIMYPSCFLQMGISQSDRNTLALLYSDNQQEASKQAEATAYPHRQFSAAEQCQKLTGEGTQLAMNGDFARAIEKLKEALKLDPNSSLARKNIAVATNNLAIDAEKADNQKVAISFFRQSIYYDPQQEMYKQNLNNILQSKGLDAKNFEVRLKQAMQCESDRDLVGAFVEYGEALNLKKDPLVAKHVADLNAVLDASVKIKGSTPSSTK